VGPDHGAGMNDAARADAAIGLHSHARMKQSPFANGSVAAQVAACADDGIRTYSCTGFDHDMRPDAGAGVDHSVRIDHGTRMNASRRRNAVLRGENLRRPGKISVRVGRNYTRTGVFLADSRIIVGGNNQGRGAGGCGLALELGIGEKTYLRRIGDVQRGNAGQFNSAVTGQLAAQQLDQCFQPNAHCSDLFVQISKTGKPAGLRVCPRGNDLETMVPPRLRGRHHAKPYLFSAFSTLSVMSMRGLKYAVPVSCRIRSNLFSSATWRTTLLTLVKAPSNSSLRRWLTSSWNSRLRRWKSLTSSVRSRCALARSASLMTGASFSYFACEALMRASISCRSASRFSNSCFRRAVAAFICGDSARMRWLLMTPMLSCWAWAVPKARKPTRK